MGDQLNIYGSTFIQMFGNGKSLWPENWHDLFVHNMQQGTWRASLQHVSPWMCFVVAVLADDVIVMDIFVGCGLSESYWYYPIDQKRGILPGAPRKKIHNRHQNFRSKQITIEIRQCKAHLQIARLLLSSECILSDRCFLVVAEWLFTLEEADKALRRQEGRMPDLIKISIWDNIKIK